jgi:hypothetical protein
MLPSTPEEKQVIIDYMNWQAPDLTVEFVQKVYVENVISHQHAVWDVHTNVDRWWVITNPTNLYSQKQFPNMDLAVTFHVGLCVRIPRSDKPRLSDVDLEPMAGGYRHCSEALEVLKEAQEVSDFQAIGVRCREALLAFTGATQIVMPWTGSAVDKPKQADFKVWVDHVCATALSGQTHEHRRHLFRTLLMESWNFSNWLTHAKASTWYDAEAAASTVEHTLGLAGALVIHYVRGVPEACPACGSNRLEPQRGTHPKVPDVEFERPSCPKCGWVGEPVPVLADPQAYAGNKVETPPPDEPLPPAEPFILPEVPLRELLKPVRRKKE